MTAFTPEQKAALAAPLSKTNVRQREQSGRKLSYLEGWHAIAEANRIFGFDGWHRETVDIRCVSERPRTIGQAKREGHGVSYVARVRITVGDIVREGVGAGHGIDADLGLAHESAIKEAETDAMKRALMTFGNPFGLALYDKSMANVGEPEREPQGDESFRVSTFVAEMKDAIAAQNDAATFRTWWSDQTRKMSPEWLPSEKFAELKGAAMARLNELEKGRRAA